MNNCLYCSKACKYTFCSDECMGRQMVKEVSENGGEYSFKTVGGKIQDIHYSVPLQAPESPVEAR